MIFQLSIEFLFVNAHLCEKRISAFDFQMVRLFFNKYKKADCKESEIKKQLQYRTKIFQVSTH